MEVISYALFALAAAAWVMRDALQRRAPVWKWVALAFVAGPLGVGWYLARRPLRLGESRVGGSGWQVARGSALAVAVLVPWLVLAGALVAAAGDGRLPSWGMRGAAISAGVAAVSLAIGAALRRSGSIELGPTGPFIAEALERWKTGPNALARTSYDCAECGQTVQAGAAFCSNCGAWPGQSG